MKKFAKKIIQKLASLLPLRNVIVFESIPDMSDNTRGIFDEMMKRGMNKKYKFVWVVARKSPSLPKLPNVSYLYLSGRFLALRSLYYRIFARVLISCNYFWPTFRKRQMSFYITHGSPVKSVRSYYNAPAELDFVLVDGEGTRETVAHELKYDVNRIVALGYPRNDVLVKAPKDIRGLFPENAGQKIIVWYPTYRQHKNRKISETERALPVMHDEKQAVLLNEMARENNILIVLKPHFAQNVANIKKCNLSNIRFIDDKFFVDNCITSYEFIAGCDALITDYSSVYHDYLLCDKPIGLVWEDYEEYKNTVNFAVDMDHYMKAGVKIYNIEDFGRFLADVANGNDTLKAERAEISKWANYSNDGRSAERVVDFIVKTAKLKDVSQGNE